MKFTLSSYIKNYGRDIVTVEAPTLEAAIRKYQEELGGKGWIIESVREYVPRKLSDTERAAQDENE